MGGRAGGGGVVSSHALDIQPSLPPIRALTSPICAASQRTEGMGAENPYDPFLSQVRRFARNPIPNKRSIRNVKQFSVTTGRKREMIFPRVREEGKGGNRCGPPC